MVKKKAFFHVLEDRYVIGGYCVHAKLTAKYANIQQALGPDEQE
jgi:hypothetical protein